MKILYVEDDPMDVDLTRRVLQRKAPQFQLVTASSQAEALQRLREDGGFDLLLTDLHLPDGSGFSLLSYVRSQNLPLAIVLITGQGDEETAVSAMKAGANDYLVKREDYLEHLATTLESAYQRYQAEVELRRRPLRVLYLESNLLDADLTQQHFNEHAPHIHLDVVHSPMQVMGRLPASPSEEATPSQVLPEAASPEKAPPDKAPPDKAPYDLLLMDFRKYDLGMWELLKELRQVRGLDLPIVLMTDQGDDELAAQTLRLGANDYVVKNPGYLFRLPGLLENAYHRTQLQREQIALRASEERYRRLAENAPDILVRYRLWPSAGLDYVSPAVQAITGYPPEQFFREPDLLDRIIVPEDQDLLTEFHHSEKPVSSLVLRVIRSDGQLIWLEGRSVPIFDAAGRHVAQEGILRDITEQRRAQEQIQLQLRRLSSLRTIDTAITSNLDLRVTLNVLLEQVITHLGVDAALILRFNPFTQTLEYVAGIGFHSRLAEGLHLRLGEGLSGQTALQRRPLRLNSFDHLKPDDPSRKLLESERFTAYWGTPLVAKSQLKGVLEVYQRSPLEPEKEWVSFFETLAKQAAIAIDNVELFDSLQRANIELTLAYDITLEGWVRALDLRDKETQDHTQRVVDLTLRLARAAGISDAALPHIRRGALLHDIGKIGIPDQILHKAGPLTAEEWQIMRMHPVYAYNLLSPIEYLRPALDIPYCHHEWWNGTGYPRGLAGEQIPLAARLFAVVDVWEALSSDRPYRRAWERERVLEYIRAQAGVQLDPRAVELLFKLLEEHPVRRD